MSEAFQLVQHEPDHTITVNGSDNGLWFDIEPPLQQPGFDALKKSLRARRIVKSIVLGRKVTKEEAKNGDEGTEVHRYAWHSSSPQLAKPSELQVEFGMLLNRAESVAAALWDEGITVTVEVKNTIGRSLSDSVVDPHNKRALPFGL